MNEKVEKLIQSQAIQTKRVTTTSSRSLESAAKTALYGASYAIRLDSPPEGTHPAHGKVYRAYWGRLTAIVRGSVR
jgi:hypothetical protein